jgi:hypothetical protein
VTWHKELSEKRRDKLTKLQGAYEQRGQDFSRTKNRSFEELSHQRAGTERWEKVQRKLGKLALDKKRIEPTVPRTGYIIRNAAYVYYDNKRLLQYFKQVEHKERGKTQSGEISQAEKKILNAKFIPGYKDGVFELRSKGGGMLRCGLEVCADHYNGQLKHSTEGEQGVDLHFLLSDYSYNYVNNVAIRDNGYFIHASTVGPQSEIAGVYKLVASKLESVDAAQSIELSEHGGAGTLSFYDPLITVQ